MRRQRPEISPSPTLTWTRHPQVAAQGSWIGRAMCETRIFIRLTGADIRAVFLVTGTADRVTCSGCGHVVTSLLVFKVTTTAVRRTGASAIQQHEVQDHALSPARRTCVCAMRQAIAVSGLRGTRVFTCSVVAGRVTTAVVPTIVLAMRGVDILRTDRVAIDIATRGAGTGRATGGFQFFARRRRLCRQTHRSLHRAGCEHGTAHQQQADLHECMPIESKILSQNHCPGPP